MNRLGPPSLAAQAQRVLRGEYDLPYEHPAPVILDVGANAAPLTP
jgi:hypothetical protein